MTVTTATPRRISPTGSFQIGTLRGVPIHVAKLFPVGVLIFAFLYGQRIFPVIPNVAALFLLPLAFIAVFTITICLHQAAHVAAARICGLEVHEVSLTIWGGYPTFVEWRSNCYQHIFVAAAGPAMNFFLAAATSLISQSLYGTPLFIAQAFLLSNLGIGLFNLIPAPPTDAGIILEAVVSHFTKSRANGRRIAGLCGLIITILSLLWALYTSATAADSTSWLNFFIPIFFYSAAARMRKSAKETEKLDAITFFSASDPGYLVSDNATIAHAIQAAGNRTPILISGDSLVGIVPPRSSANGRIYAKKVALPCRNSPIDLCLDDPLITVIYAMEQLELIAVVARMSDGEPRVMTHQMAANAMNKFLFESAKH
ncbi:MAG: site-2 protease family protein [Propionibacteriaceae bacterium]